MPMIFLWLFFGFFLSPFPVWICLQVFAWIIRKNITAKRQNVLQDLNVSPNDRQRFVGFFHPYWWVKCTSIVILLFNFLLEDSNAGGGGERVLWSAIAILQAKEPEIVSIIYSGDIDATKTQILDKVKVIAFVLCWNHV